MKTLQAVLEEMHTIDGWFHDDEAEALARFAKIAAERGHTLVEVGSYYGRSTRVLSWVAEQHDLRVIAVDLWQRTEETHPEEKEYPYEKWADGASFRHVFEENMQKFGCTNVDMICMSSQLAPEQFGDHSIQFIFHDASHDKPSVEKDLKAWLPKLAQNAIWCQHDYDQSGGRALDECPDLEKIEVVRSLAVFLVNRQNALYPDWFWERQNTSEYAGARVIMPVVFSAFNPIRSVVDFGCGLGCFLDTAKRLGATRVLGLDGAWVPGGKRKLSAAEFEEVDLARPVSVGQFDLAICLEVAEHLPESRAASLVTDITNASNVVLWSAATPGQGGEGHINEQPFEYWEQLFNARGFHAFDLIRAAIEDNDEVPIWYRWNAVIFKR